MPAKEGMIYNNALPLLKANQSYSLFSANVKGATKSRYNKNLDARKAGSPLVPNLTTSTARTGLA